MKNTFNKPVLIVTGSEGSLAQWMIPNLVQDYTVIGIDNCVRYGTQDLQRDYVLEKGDLCNINWVSDIFSKYQPEFIMHCAAQIYGVVGFHKFSADILGGNVASTQSVLANAVKHGVQKISYISSSMVYERATHTPFLEDVVDDLPCPRTGYGLSKLLGERLVKEYHQQYKLDYVIWRPFNIVSPKEKFDTEPGIAHVVADFIKKIVVDRCESVEIFGNGQQVRCFTWIDDVAKIIVTRSWDPQTSAQCYNIGSETPTRIVDLAQTIWQRSGRTDPFRAHYIDSYKDDVIDRVPNSNKIKQLGWSHSKSLEDIVDICLSAQE